MPSSTSSTNVFHPSASQPAARALSSDIADSSDEDGEVKLFNNLLILYSYFRSLLYCPPQDLIGTAQN